MKKKQTQGNTISRKPALAGTAGSAIPDSELRKALEKDFNQFLIDSLTPDRGYMTPIDNVKALILRYWPNTAVRHGAQAPLSGPTG